MICVLFFRLYYFLRRIYMKKFISAIIAASMCALMFTACGDKDAGEENLTESVAAETDAAEDTTTAKQEETTAAEDNSDDEDIVIDGEDEDKDSDSGDMLTFDSFDDISVDEIFAVDSEYIAYEESNLHNYFSKLTEDATELYMDVEATDGSVSATIAISQDKIAMNAFEGSSATEISIIIKDGMMYMLSPEEKTGFYMPIDESMMEEYDIESMLSQANIDSNMDTTEIKAAMVIIGGTEYVFEFNDESGMIFDTDGKLCAMISLEGSNGINTMLVHEFSSTVPDNAFDVPDDYEIMDLASAFTVE